MQGLENLQVKRIDRAGLQICFTAGIFRFFVWNDPLVAIGYGELAVEPADGGLVVIYRIRFTKLLVMVSIMAFGIGPALLNGSDLKLNVRDLFIILIAPWAVLICLNLASALFKFPRWIRRTLEQHHR